MKPEWNKYIQWAMAACLIVVGFVGCQKVTEDSFYTVYEEVDRVVWNGHGQYSFFTKTDFGQVVVTSLPMRPYDGNNIIIMANVPLEKKQWYKCEIKRDALRGIHNSTCVIHIHDMNSLELGTIDNGKFDDVQPVELGK